MADSNGFDADKAMENIKKDRNLQMIVGGAVALIVGMFLPWVSVDTGFFDVSANGFDANGIFPLILAVVAVGAALNVMNRDKKQMAMVALVASGLGALIVLIDWPSDLDGFDGVSIGLGYYLTLLAALVMTAGSFMMFQKAGGTKSAPKNNSDSDES